MRSSANRHGDVAERKTVLQAVGARQALRQLHRAFQRCAANVRMSLDVSNKPETVSVKILVAGELRHQIAEHAALLERGSQRLQAERVRPCPGNSGG